MLIYRCLTGFISMGFSFYAMSQMVLADASSLIFISPVLTMFFVRCLGMDGWVDQCYREVVLMYICLLLGCDLPARED